MKISFEIKDEEYNGHKYQALYIVLDGTAYYLGSLKGTDFKYIRTISKSK